MSYISIAIDGPSGSGKSTAAHKLAERLGYMYVDTGAMYRTVGLYVYRKGKNPDSEEETASVLPGLDMDIEYIDGIQHMYIDGEDVSTAIREELMSVYASKVSQHKTVRNYLLEVQRSAAKKANVIMDGRDIGTVILPDASVKIFLYASNEKRAMRRWLEQKAKGIDVSYEQILADMNERDRRDSERAIAPAVAAKDAVMLDNGDIGIEETVDAIIGIIKDRLGEGFQCR